MGGVGPGERGDGIERVEQEMRVDLRLQRTDLSTSSKLLLQLELVGGELRGDELGKPCDKRVLRSVHLMGVLEVELERTDGVVAYLERRG